MIDKIDNKPSEYGKDFMKIKFNSDDNLPLNKPLKFRMLALILRSAFTEDGKYYPVFFRWIFVWVIKMLQYEKIDVSKGIDINKTKKSKEFMLCHFRYRKDIGFKI